MQLKLAQTMMLVAASIISIGMAGCGSNDGRIAVQGVVLKNGTPLEGASIAFIGNGGGAYATGLTDAEGKFSLRAAQGQNQVAVIKEDTSDASANVDIPEEEQLMGSEEEGKEPPGPKMLIDKKYADPETSELVFDVQPGMADIEINVTGD